MEHLPQKVALSDAQSAAGCTLYLLSENDLSLSGPWSQHVCRVAGDADRWGTVPVCSRARWHISAGRLLCFAMNLQKTEASWVWRQLHLWPWAVGWPGGRQVYAVVIFLPVSARTVSRAILPSLCLPLGPPRVSLGPSPAQSAGACHRELFYSSPFYAYGNN